MMVDPNPDIRVLVVDDNRDITTVLKLIIESEPGMQCAGCLNSADHLVEVACQLKPDVLVLDISMRGKDPLEALGELMQAAPGTRTIIFSAFDESELGRRIGSAGAHGVVSKSDDPEAIVRAIRAVAGGETYFPKASA